MNFVHIKQEELAGYDFTVVHRPGKDNLNADALSRRETCQNLMQRNVRSIQPECTWPSYLSQGAAEKPNPAQSSN